MNTCTRYGTDTYVQYSIYLVHLTPRGEVAKIAQEPSYALFDGPEAVQTTNYALYACGWMWV
jgi:hypothetical protein